MLEYRHLCADEISRTLFSHFIRHQTVTKCLRQENGTWTAKDAPFIDDWSEEDYQKLIACLKNTVNTGGFVYGAFLDSKLKGIASVESDFFGSICKYLDLSCLHVSEDVRGKGIGTELFRRAKDWAKAHGADKLYISSHSAVETQAFYQRMGCVDTKEYNQMHVDQEPYDRQLECSL